jgi:hypothetical protein
MSLFLGIFAYMLLVSVLVGVLLALIEWDLKIWRWWKKPIVGVWFCFTIAALVTTGLKAAGLR